VLLALQDQQEPQAQQELQAQRVAQARPERPVLLARLQSQRKGDLQGFSTVAARVPVGSDGQVLTADSTQALGVKYATPAASGSSSLIQLLQFKAGTVGSGTITATFTNATQRGSTIVVEYLGVNDITTVNDAQGDNFTRYNRQSWGGFAYVSQFVATNIVGGTTTITASGSGQFNIYEYSNVDSVDTSISAQNSGGTTSVATGAITTALPGEVVHMYGAFNVTGGATSNTAAWPLIQLVTSTSGTTASYNTIQAAAGSISNTFTHSASSSFDYVSLLALKPRAIPPFGVQTVTTVGTSGLASITGTNLNVPNYSAGGGTGALILLEAHTASSSAELDFTSCITSSYDVYQVEIVSLIPATNNIDIILEFSTNGGSSYDTISGHYGWTSYIWRAGASAVEGSASTPNISLTSAISQVPNAAGQGGVMGDFKIYNPLSGTAFTRMKGIIDYEATSLSSDLGNIIVGSYLQTTAVNAFRIRATSGNLASGTVRVYGITH
jgi:hypothetical protein